jgi:hypothetical protein
MLFLRMEYQANIKYKLCVNGFKLFITYIQTTYIYSFINKLIFYLSALLILPYTQQHQRTRVIGSYAVLVGKVAQFGIFGTGVKYNAPGFGVNNVIVQGRLVLRAYVQGYGINIGMYGFGLFYGYACYFAGFNANVNNGMSAAC